MGKIIKLEGLGLHDVTIIPSTLSSIRHRSDVNPFRNDFGEERYPIFVAPMGAVTDENNYKTWLENKVTPVIPRTVGQRLSFDERMNLAKEAFVSVSLDEAESLIKLQNIELYSNGDKRHICIDLANGHMSHLLETCKKIKQFYGAHIVIMTGNIANPETYKKYCSAGIDYVRVGIGGGSRCTTSAATGIHFPMATLIDECHKIQEKMTFKTKIIADGGMGWFDDINKSLALGADYVMLGRLFAECEEACGEIGYAENEEAYKNGMYCAKEAYKSMLTKLLPFRNYAGMSHRSMQKETGGDGSKVSEGIVLPVAVKYTTAHFMELLESYLRSAMSYTNSKNLDEFKDSVLIKLTDGGMAYRK